MIVNSERSKEEFKSYVDRMFAEHKWLTFSEPRIGEDRSILQNSLLHVWLTELAAHFAKCDKKEVTAGMVEGTKRTVKGCYYREFNEPWMVHQIVCPISGRTRMDYTSSASWKQGEMFHFLTWLQAFAAQHGCILESKGEYAKLQRTQNR